MAASITTELGFGGTLSLEAEELCVSEWSLNMKSEVLPYTNTCSDGWDENAAGTLSFDGAAKAIMDVSDIPTGTAGFVNGAEGNITLLVGSTGKSYSGNVIITNATVVNNAKQLVTFDITFTGNGPLTYAS